jgi:hypothetical protein
MNKASTLTLYLTQEETELVEKLKLTLGEKTASKVFKKLLLYPERYEMLLGKSKGEELLKKQMENKIEIQTKEFNDIIAAKNNEIKLLEDRITNFVGSFRSLILIADERTK